MADARSIAALNIGSQRLTCAELDITNKGGLVLKNYSSTSILADPSRELARLPQIRVVVNELVTKLGVAKEKVNYAITGQSVFTRFVQLPALDNDDIEQLVRFEAQQHVPFPINEVVWDWQLLGSHNGQHEIVLVAIKADALDGLNECLINADLVTNKVEASPMALANAFLYNYSDLEECAILIDIGARTSNLIYKEGTKIFTRTVAIGGSTITSAIAKEYGVDFSEAETQKITNGLVALDTHHTSGLDELTAALGACIRTSLNRVPAEIARTTNFFRNQHGGSAPQRVLLAGGGSNMPMISDFLEDKLRLPVEYFNPLRNVSVGKGLNLEKVSIEAHMLGEIIGLGVSELGQDSKFSVDLIPESVEEERANAKRRPKVVIAALIAIVASTVYAVTGFLAKSNAIVEESEFSKELAAIKVFSDPIEQEIKDSKKVEEIVNHYAEAVRGRTVWLKVMNDLNASEYGVSTLAKLNLPSEFNRNGRVNKGYTQPYINAVKVEGFRRSASNQLVLDRLENLMEQSEFFTMNKLNSNSLSKSKKDKVFTTGEIVVSNETAIAVDKIAAPFTIILPLTYPIPVK